MSFCAIVFLGKRPFGQMSSGQMYFWANVFLDKRLLSKRLMGKCPSGQMSFWANVFWANVVWANVFLGKCLSGQMSSGQMSFWANFVWANVSRQMSYGQMSWNRARDLYEPLLLLNFVDQVPRPRLYIQFFHKKREMKERERNLH
jgi:hypothetical protein